MGIFRNNVAEYADDLSNNYKKSADKLANDADDLLKAAHELTYLLRKDRAELEKALSQNVEHPTPK